MDEYHKVELNEIFSRTRSLESLRSQFGTFFGTVNLTALGLAFSVQKAGIVFLAAAIFAVQIIIDVFVRRNLVVLYYRGLQLERKYSAEVEESLLHIYVDSTLSEANLSHQLLEISNLKEPSQRLAKLRDLRFTSGGFWLLMVGVVVEVVIGVVLLFQGWSLF
jgi:hypothetical protein